VNTKIGWYGEFRRNLGLVLGAAAVFYIALRILSAAGFDIETAYAILQDAGTANVLAGAALNSLSYAAGPIALAFLLYFSGLKDKRGAERPLIIAAIFFVAVMLILVSPAAEVLAIALLFIVAHLTSRRRLKRYEATPPLTDQSLEDAGTQLSNSLEAMRIRVDSLREKLGGQEASRESSVPGSESVAACKHLLAEVTELLIDVTEKREVAPEALDTILEMLSDLPQSSDIELEIGDTTKSILDFISAMASFNRTLEVQERRLVESERKLASLQGHLKEAEEARARNPYVIAIYTLAVLLLPIVGMQVWLPSERIYVMAQAPFTGYVLSESFDFTAVLKDEPRAVVIVGNEKVQGRVTCIIPSAYYSNLTILEWITIAQPPRYPSCHMAHRAGPSAPTVTSPGKRQLQDQSHLAKARGGH
jgi:hypothetical protein